MKLYIKEFYKTQKRYFLCKEHHATAYEPFYVLYDIKEKCYLKSIFGNFFTPVKNHMLPWYYSENEIKISAAFRELGIVPDDKTTIYPALYCQERFGFGIPTIPVWRNR